MDEYLCAVEGKEMRTSRQDLRANKIQGILLVVVLFNYCETVET